MKILTQNLTEVHFRNPETEDSPNLNDPVIYLIHTDSYSDHDVSLFKKLLTSQELQNASRFRLSQDRSSYIITHAKLRLILGDYLDEDPVEIEFNLNEFGKPSLTENKIHFNISHRGGLSALAFSFSSEIGIDVEKIDPDFNVDQISKAFFSRDENRYLNDFPFGPNKKFYMLWTRKEAFLKALGTGIAECPGVEVFRRANDFNPKIPIPGIGDRDYFLYTFEYQDHYMITTAQNSPSSPSICWNEL